MREPLAEVLLHPVRLRIVQLIVASRQATAQQLAAILTDVPPATLYRHLAKLANAGLLQIVEQRRVRGATEKVYALPDSGAVLGAEAFATATPEDHLRYFMTFLASLIGNFARYLDGGDVDLARDGIGYRMLPLYLSDEEMLALSAEVSGPLRAALANPPAPHRRLRQLATILMPAMDLPDVPPPPAASS